MSEWSGLTANSVDTATDCRQPSGFELEIGGWKSGLVGKATVFLFVFPCFYPNYTKVEGLTLANTWTVVASDRPKLLACECAINSFTFRHEHYDLFV